MHFIKGKIAQRFGVMLLALATVFGFTLAAAPAASASSATITCYATDGGYRVKMTADWIKASGKVDLNYTQIDQEHRTFGVWSNEDWASSWTVRWVVNGVIISSGSGNPPQALQWNPGTAAQTYDPPVYTRTTFSGSGTSISNCRYDIP